MNKLMIMIIIMMISNCNQNPIQTEELETEEEVPVAARNISTRATITHSMINFHISSTTVYDTESKQEAAISDGDKTTNASASEEYQVNLNNIVNATITHSFSKTYKNGVYKYYGNDISSVISVMNGSTVQFMHNNTVVETVTITNATKDITVTPNPSTAFNKVVITFAGNWAAFYEIEILGDEAIASVEGVYSVQIVPPASYGDYVEVGEELQLSAGVSAISGVAKTVSWTTSDATVATVNSSGEVTVLTVGTATITATSTADMTQTAELEITVLENLSVGATLTHTITAFNVVSNSPYDTESKQEAAISDGDKTTDANATTRYQVGIGGAQTGATITHSFSGTYKNGVYKYYGANHALTTIAMNGSTVQFMNDNTVVETVTITNATKDITVVPNPSTVFNKVVTTIASYGAAFYEIEILGDEAIASVGGVYTIELIVPASYDGYVEVDDSLQLLVDVLVINGVTETVSWTTSDATVATVSGSGKITALTAGLATITAISMADTTQTAELEITIIAANNISIGASITHTMIDFHISSTTAYDTEAKQGAAISDGDKTTDASASEEYQVNLGAITNATITHSFSKTYKNGVYKYYGNGISSVISAMNGSTVQFMNDNTVVETVTITNATKDITVVPNPSTAFNKVVIAFAGTVATFYEIEILGDEAIASVGGVYFVNIIIPSSYGDYVEVGEDLQLSADVSAISGVAKTVSWTTSDATVATVNSSGEVTVLTVGTATITATSTADMTQTAELEITVLENLSVGATLTHTITAFNVVSNSPYDTDAKMVAAISDGDKTTDASATTRYQVGIGGAQTGATITHSFSGTYKNGVYKYYGANHALTTIAMKGSTVQFMNDNTVVETVTITNATKDITVVPNPSTVFNKVVTTIASYGAAFYEIEILGDEAIASVGGVYTIELIVPASYDGYVEVDDSLQLLVDVLVINGVTETVSWTTSDATVATVSGSGKITALTAGLATITAISMADTTQTAELEITIIAANNISIGASITHTMIDFHISSTTAYDTEAKQGAAISDGDKTTDASASEEYQVNLGAITNATITHSFSKTYKNGVYKYYGNGISSVISAMNGSTVQFMNDNTVVETVTITNATKDITVVPNPSTAFNKVVIAFAGTAAAFYEIEILGDEAIASVGGVYFVNIIIPSSYGDYVEVGEDLQLSADVSAISGVAKTVSWTTSDATVATVNSSGEVTVLTVGTATITATSTADMTQTAELEITVLENLSVGATLTHTITAFNVVSNSPYDTDAKMVAAISNGDKTTDASATTRYQVGIGGVQTGATITHSFSGTYKNGIYKYYGANHVLTTIAMKGSTVQFMNDNTVVETVTITNATKDITVVPNPSTVFNKVVTTIAKNGAAFYEIEIVGIEAPSVRGVYSIELIVPASYIAKGKNLQLSASVSAISGVAETVSWTTSDIAIATVNSSGKVTAVREGIVTITATSTADTTQTAELEVTVLENLSTGATITHTMIDFSLPANTAYDTESKQEAAISDGDDTTDASASEEYQVNLGSITNATITHSFSDIYKNGVYKYYGNGISSVISAMDGSTVQFMNDNTVVETVTITDATKDITVIPDPSTVFNTVVLTFAGTVAVFYEIEVLGVEVPSVERIYSVQIIPPVSYGDYVEVGDSLELSTRVLAISGIAETVSWTTSDATVATVNSSGKVTALTAGIVTITAISTVDTTQTAELEIAVIAVRNISIGATITHTMIDFSLPANTAYDTESKQEAAISDGDKTTDASASEEYQVNLGSITNATITHSFSKTYKNGVYKYYGNDISSVISAMNGSTVQFMNDNTVVETVTITDATKDITVIPNPLTAFNKVVIAFAGTVAAFYEIEILGDEAIASVGGVYTIELISPVSYGDYVEVGDSLELSTRVLAISGASQTVSWTTSDATVATVSGSGKITALTAGLATITAISMADTTQTAELEITIIVANNISIGASITHTMIDFSLPANTAYDTESKQEAAISDGDNTTNASASEEYQVNLGAITNATITHNFSKTYKNGVYKYYGNGISSVISAMNGSTVQFMNDNTVVETVTITDATKDITVIPNPSTAFNKVVIAFAGTAAAFYEIEILGDEAIASVGGVYFVNIIIPSSYGDYVEVGEDLQLSADVSAISGVAKTVSWTTSDATVATVNSSGEVTVLTVGTATITATSTADMTQTAELEITVLENLSVGATLTHTITAFNVVSNSPYDTDAKMVAAISNGDKTTDASATTRYQVGIGGVQTGATITHSFSGTYKNGIYKYYGANHVLTTIAMKGSTVQFMNDSIVVETVTITNATKDITVVPNPSTVFNKVVTTIAKNGAAFYEIEIVGIEAPSVERIYSVQIIPPVSYGDYVEVGDSLELSTRVLAISGIAETVSWTTSDATVATVNSSGKVTALTAGIVTITAISTVDTTQTAELEIAVIAVRNISIGATITHSMTNFYISSTTAYDTEAKQEAAISDGDKTTDASASEEYQVNLGAITNATITHNFSKTYKNGVYKYYGNGISSIISAMNGSTVQFMNDNTVVETVTITNATKDITVIPNPSTAFNKVVIAFAGTVAAFYEIEILGDEAIASVGGVYFVNIIIPSSYGDYVEVGEELQLSADVSAISGVAKTISWTTSDATVATVNSSGEVTVLTVGTATITATSTADMTQTAELEITVLENLSVGATLTHTITAFNVVSNSLYDTDAKMVAAISNGDKTTDASATTRYQVGIGGAQTGATITHSFSGTYKNGIYKYYGANHALTTIAMKGSTVQFMNDNTVVETVIITNATKDITVVPNPSTVFNKVVTTIASYGAAFYEIEILGIEVTE